jgi:DNA-binding response OmpR family regulator
MSEPCILIVEADGLVRAPLAQYLRECGYLVLEATNAEEARQLLTSGEWRINLVMTEVESVGGNGFRLGTWVRRTFPNVGVIFVGGVARAAEKAGDLCEEGPTFSKPYHHRIVLDRIQSSLAARERNAKKGYAAPYPKRWPASRRAGRLVNMSRGARTDLAHGCATSPDQAATVLNVVHLSVNCHSSMARSLASKSFTLTIMDSLMPFSSGSVMGADAPRRAIKSEMAAIYLSRAAISRSNSSLSDIQHFHLI